MTITKARCKQLNSMAKKLIDAGPGVVEVIKQSKWHHSLKPEELEYLKNKI